MIKRKFGMEYLNISQSRFGTFSHSNLNAYDLTGRDTGADDYIATYPYEIIGVHRFNYSTGKGFANTVHFYDKENNITVVMTHKTDLPTTTYYVGKVFSVGDVMYREGIAGKVSGNHIHLEIARGKQSIKKKIGSIYKMDHLINIEDYFFIDEKTFIRDTKGIQFEIRSERMILQDGLTKTVFNGQPVYIYKQGDNEEIGLIGTENWKDTKTINEFRYGDLDITCLVNASYFENTNSSSYGQVYGREQGLNKDNRPDSDKFLDLVINSDNNIESGNFASWEWEKPYVKLGVSYACCVLKDGYTTDEYSKQVGISKLTVNNTQTLLMKDKTRYYLAVVGGKLNGYECRNLARQYGMTDCYMLDSGGSSQMVVNGSKVVYTGRKLPNVICFYKKNNTVSDTTPKQEVKTIGKIHIHRIGLWVRKTLSFDKRTPTGAKLKLIKKGGSIDLVDFIPNIQADGFQWVKVLYKGEVAYCQYDSTCYTIEIEGER